MPLNIPIDVLHILKTLSDGGYQAYIVGGAVRDVMMGMENPTDWDFTADATPEQILALFPESFYENEFGTVAISRNHVREQFELPLLEDEDKNTNQSKVIELDKATKLHESLQAQTNPDQKLSPQQTKNLFEITTFRSDGAYSDFRRPDTVTWGKTIEEDLERRDFTINAMAIQVNADVLKKLKPDHKNDSQTLETKQYTLIDPHHGQSDLKEGLIRTVGNPTKRFQEDALRMLRAIRFSVQLNFGIDDPVWEAIIANADLIQKISWERIRDEFLKMLGSQFPKESIEMLDESGLLKHILPELLEMKGVEQGGHHRTDVWTHSLDALGSTPATDPIVRLATLLHDIAKPQTFARTSRTITFYNHEIIGSRMAKKIAERLKLSKKDIQRIFILVRHHMFHYEPHHTDSAIRRFMRRVGLDNINDIIDLRIGDRLGSGSRETSWRFEEMKQRMQEQLHQPFEVRDLAIDGNDLMTELNLQPGKIIGEILQALFEEVLENPELNKREVLLEKAKALKQTFTQ